jgi:hypothetical protein
VGFAAAQPPQTGSQPSPVATPAALDFNDHTGFTQIFDGQTLNGWDRHGPPFVMPTNDRAPE